MKNFLFLRYICAFGFVYNNMRLKIFVIHTLAYYLNIFLSLPYITYILNKMLIIVGVYNIWEFSLIRLLWHILRVFVSEVWNIEGISSLFLLFFLVKILWNRGATKFRKRNICKMLKDLYIVTLPERYSSLW